MLKTFLIYGFLIVTMSLNAQLAKVEYNYNTVGDCILGAQNNSKTPVYLYLWFTNLANSSMREPLPYVKNLIQVIINFLRSCVNLNPDHRNLPFKQKPTVLTPFQSPI